jgi:hypothetical protein
MISPLRSLSLAALLVASVAGPHAASASDKDRPFFTSVQGEWAGGGEVIAGKYKGTKFNCTFSGSAPGRKIGMVMDGGCRVGPFMQKMTASIESRKGRGYHGTFLDGAAGKGLDITGGNVVDGEKVVLAINRKQLTGIMQARMAGRDTMNVTVSVHVAKQLVPVIGLSLKRVDGTAVGSID